MINGAGVWSTVGVLRLLTFNALFQGDARPRLRALGAILAQSPYDVVCLQEVLYRNNLKLLRTAGYAHVAASGSVMLQGGLAILSRAPIRARFTRFKLRGPARPEWLMRKGAQVALLETAAGPLAVVNTHLSANRDDDWSAGNRYTAVERAELDELAGLIADIDAAVPVVTVGDFNVPRDTAPLAEFLHKTGMRDALAGNTEPTYRPTPQWPSPPAFDHILLRGAVTAHAELVFQQRVRLTDGRSAYLSDHYGVDAQLIFD